MVASVLALAVRFRRVFATLFVGVALLSGSSPPLAQSRLDGVVVSDHDAAVRAGMGILEQGGNAVDAAVAAAFALAVVDPASSGLGGGGVMVLYQSKENKAHALDFAPVSPAAGLYRKEDGVDRDALASGPLSVAVPGTVAGLVDALERFGALPLETVLAPAVRHAAEGFPVTPRLRRTIRENLAVLLRRADLAGVFLNASGAPHEVGETIRQPELAESLEAIARDGAAAFYEGAVGRSIASRMADDGGAVTLDDLHSYRPVWRQPVIGSYRGRTVITAPPPSLGGLALVGLLNVMEGYGPDRFRHNSGAYLHLIAETAKAGAVDLPESPEEPDSGRAPVRRATSRERASAVRRQIHMDLASPRMVREPTPRTGEAVDAIGVLDGDGNAVAMSLGMGNPFGAGMLARGTGVVLNNQMRGFSLPSGSGTTAGNAPNLLRPRQRPVNRMTPAILLRDHRPVLVIGASGGSRTVGAVLQTILNVVDFRMPLAEAVAAARIHVPVDAPLAVDVEDGVGDEAVASLRGKGHTVRRSPRLGAVQAIRVEGRSITAVSEPGLGAGAGTGEDDGARDPLTGNRKGP